jgi:hypothetical protein
VCGTHRVRQVPGSPSPIDMAFPSLRSIFLWAARLSTRRWPTTRNDLGSIPCSGNTGQLIYFRCVACVGQLKQIHSKIWHAQIHASGVVYSLSLQLITPSILGTLGQLGTLLGLVHFFEQMIIGRSVRYTSGSL